MNQRFYLSTVISIYRFLFFATLYVLSLKLDLLCDVSNNGTIVITERITFMPMDYVLSIEGTEFDPSYINYYFFSFLFFYGF